MPDQPKKSLKEIAEDKLKSNPSALGDPVSLKAETSDSDPAKDPENNGAGGDGGDKPHEEAQSSEQKDKKKRDSKL